ncbi:MAG: thymidine kinase [bacterium]
MAKLYFRYGVMGSGKSTQLLQIAHDYEEINNKSILVIKPKVDTKANDCVTTRMGNGLFVRKCDFLIKPQKDWLFNKMINGLNQKLPDIILVDEAQFLSKENVWDLALLVAKYGIPIICFGLRSDFRGEPFEGSSHLFALADDVEEITTRALSRLGDDIKRGTMNLRLVNGEPKFSGNQVSIDGKDDVEYKPVSLKQFVLLKSEYKTNN